jgi:hypothetical protein
MDRGEERGVVEDRPGSRAAIITWWYGMPRNSASRTDAAPITGGMICPPVEATASIAAAASGLKPVRFIIGIVSQPSTITFADRGAGDRAERGSTTRPRPCRARRAARPRCRLAKFMKNWPAPDFSRNAPKMMKRMTYDAATPSGMPKRPSLVKIVWSMRISYVRPL